VIFIPVKPLPKKLIKRLRKAAPVIVRFHGKMESPLFFVKALFS